MVLERFGDPELFRRAEEGLQSGELTLKECMELEYTGVRVPLEEANAWLLGHARIRSGFREVARRYRPLILSSGFAEMIDSFLARERVEAEVLANSIDPRPDGWRVIWRDEARCEHCDEPCKRGALPPGRVVYVGDGYSDRCAALAADLVFATDGLARYLEEIGRPYEPFTDFVALDRALAGRR